VTQAEIQQSVQRFCGQFIDRIVDAMTQLATSLATSGNRLASDTALRSTLLYASSSLDIATGPLPEVNVLDMVVFIRLCREVFETHWLPYYGEAARAVEMAFESADREMLSLAGDVLSDEQLHRLTDLIAAWRTENPNQVRVEWVRLLDFSHHAGAVETERQRQAGGLMADVKKAGQVADRAVLLAERGMFLANRMPFLLRTQARLGSREIMSDALTQIGSRDATAAVSRPIDSILKRGILYLGLLGGALSVIWWGGYYVSKRALARRRGLVRA